MGRYDGEDYAERPPCRPGEHNWAMNGTCWRCGHDRSNLISNARKVLETERVAVSHNAQPQTAINPQHTDGYRAEAGS